MSFNYRQRFVLLTLLVIGLSLTNCLDDSKQNDLKKPSNTSQSHKNSNSEGWSHQDRLKAIEQIEQVRDELEAQLGDQTDAFIACYLGKIEDAYPNLKALDSDNTKATQISKECAESLVNKE